MKTLLRALITLLIVLWLGAICFFPVVAQVAFGSLPDKHAAGTIVRLCLSNLHVEGIVCGVILLFLLPIAGFIVRVYGSSVLAPMLVVILMLGLTMFSQDSIMPRMDVLRLAVGGNIENVPPGDLHRMRFNQLHAISVRVEGGVMVLGILLITLLSRPRTD